MPERGSGEGSAAPLVDRLEREAVRRFARWDSVLWRQVVGGPARQLAEGLEAVGYGGRDGAALLESYLGLARDAIGLGYLVRAASLGTSTFLTLAWTRLLPAALPGLPPERRAAALAECWNLGENLAHGTPWLHRLFLRLAVDRLEVVADPSGFVAEVSGRALGEPAERLGAEPRIVWVFLAGEDPRFLPGHLHFLAPTVACVHDRRRVGGGGQAAVTAGVWLEDPPLVLGALGCREHPGDDDGARLDLLERLEHEDPRAADWRGMIANEWRAAVTLETSQFLVALLP